MCVEVAAFPAAVGPDDLSAADAALVSWPDAAARVSSVICVILSAAVGRACRSVSPAAAWLALWFAAAAVQRTIGGGRSQAPSSDQ